MGFRSVVGAPLILFIDSREIRREEFGGAPNICSAPLYDLFYRPKVNEKDQRGDRGF